MRGDQPGKDYDEQQQVNERTPHGITVEQEKLFNRRVRKAEGRDRREKLWLIDNAALRHVRIQFDLAEGLLVIDHILLKDGE